jgi:hypothetical protein
VALGGDAFANSRNYHELMWNGLGGEVAALCNGEVVGVALSVPPCCSTALLFDRGELAEDGST